MEALFSWQRFGADVPLLLPYFLVTVKIVFWGIGVGLVLGIVLACLRLRHLAWLEPILHIYVSFMRGTPMLVQLLIIFYGLPLVLAAVGVQEAVRWDKMVFVYAAFALNETAFLSEIFRSAILAVPAGQLEAAYAVGLTRWQAYRRIVLPQAWRIALPGFGADFIALFHGTSLAFLVGVIDIMGRAQALGASTHHALEGYLFVALLFIVCSLGLRVGFNYLDRRLAYGR